MRTHRCQPRRSIVVALLVAFALVAMGPTPVGAADTEAIVATETDTTPTTQVETDGPSPAGNILPRPGSGQAPESAGDPGGWLQYTVFGLIIGGVALIALLVARESKKARAARS